MQLYRNVNTNPSENDIHGEVYFNLVEHYIEFVNVDNNPQEYVDLCANHLNSFTLEVKQSLCNATHRHRNEIEKAVGKSLTPYPKDPLEILKYIKAHLLIIPYPENPIVPIAQLELSCDWEEHHIEWLVRNNEVLYVGPCLLYTSPSPRDLSTSRMPSSA